MPTGHRRGLARFGRCASVLACLDLAIVIVLAAHLAGGIAAGASPRAIADADPLRLLGQRLPDVGCPAAPLAVGKGTFVVCPTWTAVVSTSGVVDVVSVYGPGNDVVDASAGALPPGLAWGAPISAAWTALGRPDRITGVYGTPTLVYFFDRQVIGSLELQFDGSEHLTRVNASLVH
jgi:hypothetical protein